MAKGKKREKRPNYVGSKSQLDKQREEFERIHPNARKQTIYFEDAPLIMFVVLFLWAIFLMVDLYCLNNVILMFPATVIGLCLVAMLHMSSPNRWIKDRRYRRMVLYMLFFVIAASVGIWVYLGTSGIVVPFETVFG
jgi:membrane-bound ClpP family serine protease